jgi:hypothetical protein
MIRVVQVSVGAAHTLKLAFNDGITGMLDVSETLFGPLFEPLRDPALFAQVYVDDYGAVCWPNGADLAPDGLYLKITANAVQTVLAS